MVPEQIMELEMQVRVESGSQIVRVQRDGPSPAQQAADAVMQDLQTAFAAAQRRVNSLVESGAENTPSGRAELAEARSEMATLAATMRNAAEDQREAAIEDAAQAMAARALGQGAGRPVTIGTTAPPPIRIGRNDDIPQGAVEISIAFFVCTAAAVILFPLMRAFGRILERRAAPPQRLVPEIEQQLVRMEQSIEAVAIEVERVAEAQRFATKLLADREKVAALRD